MPAGPEVAEPPCGALTKHIDNESSPMPSRVLWRSALVESLVGVTCKFSYICNTCNFTCITCKEFWLTCKNRDSRQISSFSKKFGEIPTKFHQNLASKWQNSIKKCWKMKISLFIFEKSLTIFDWNFEVWAVQKYANLVDRVKSFPTSIYLQKSASIQPRTSLSKFAPKKSQKLRKK